MNQPLFEIRCLRSAALLPILIFQGFDSHIQRLLLQSAIKFRDVKGNLEVGALAVRESPFGEFLPNLGECLHRVLFDHFARTVKLSVGDRSQALCCRFE